VDFTRFYTYSGNKLNSKPQWQDEFSGSSLNYGKWFAANWSFAKTQSVVVLDLLFILHGKA